MDFYAVLDQVVQLLRERRRVSYRALKRQFQLDDVFLEDLTGSDHRTHTGPTTRRRPRRRVARLDR